MQVLDTIEAFRKELDALRAEGKTVGLVPTMGYLHAGHASLIERSAAECDVTAVTVFVNPLQFGANEDLSKYPRDLDRDVAIAEEAGAVLVFAPPVEEMYPRLPFAQRQGRFGSAGADLGERKVSPGGPVLTSIRVAEVSEGMEGASRPGHFDGVATVVAKLFAIAGPCRAYFGEKDFQQLAVVRRMAADLSFPVDIVGCPIVREADGLAMSSRNVYLSPDERAAATVLHRALQAGAADISKAQQVMVATVAAEPLARLDYAEVIETDNEYRLLIAARVGTTRLIDNLGVEK